MRFILIALFSTFLFNNIKAQTHFSQIPLKNLNKQTISLSDFTNENQIVVVSFWATWCKPCIAELNAVSDKLVDWQNQIDFSFIGVSTDDSRSSSKVKSVVNGSAWEFTIVLDENQDLKRQFGISNIPYTIILKNNKIKYRHAGYLPGDEQLLWQEIQKLNE